MEEVPSSNAMNLPITVGVIGCGPAGLFFLRQLEKERDRLQQQLLVQDETKTEIEERLSSLPRVTVFEKASRCGGLWQSKLQGKRGDSNEANIDSAAEDDSEGMYDGMWINAPKELFEFEDYTFDEHFRKPMPAFLTRQQVFGYLEGATGDVIDKYTTHSQDHDHGSIVFDTEVSYVNFDDEKELFSVSTVPSGTVPIVRIGEEEMEYEPESVTIHEFDKVIFATGLNNVPNIPEQEIAMLKEGSIPFERPVIHSSQVKSLGADIRGKNFLFIGAAYSAEDLALSFIKRGVNHIYVVSRTDNDYPISSTASWPMNKLTLLMRTEIKEVLENNKLRMGRREITSPVIQDIAKKYYNDAHIDFVLEDIDAVIFCTGYSINDDILDKDLAQYPEWNGEVYNADLQLDVDEDYWPNIYDPEVFDPDNGKVLPSETDKNSNGFPIHANNGMLRADPSFSYFQHVATHNNHLITNPGMFFHYEAFETPLLDLDIHSAFILKVMLGDIPTPDTKEEMFWARSRETAENLRHSAHIRVMVDEVFAEAVLLKEYEIVGFREDCFYPSAYTFYKLFSHAKLAGHPAGDMLVEVEDPDHSIQADNNYVFPDEVSSEGKQWTFSEKGLKLVQMYSSFMFSHYEVKKGTNETFRDHLQDDLQSIHTGTRPRRFSSLWLDVDDLFGDDVDGIVDSIQNEKKNVNSSSSNADQGCVPEPENPHRSLPTNNHSEL